MADEYQKKYRIPSLTTDALVLRKHKNDEFHDILLVTRGNYPEEGKLAFPGGFVEYGEEPEYGCIRELKEETELDGKDIELLTIRGNPRRDPRRHVVSIFYIVNVEPEAKPKGGDDAKDAKFYDLKDIIENKKEKIAFDHYGVIEELVQKKFKDLYNIKNLDKLKSKSKNNLLVDKMIKINSEKIKNLKTTQFNDLNDLLNQKNMLDDLQKETEKLYDNKLDFIKNKISEMISQKWQFFDKKVKEIREIKLTKEELDKKIKEIKKNSESSDKLQEQNNKKSKEKCWKAEEKDNLNNSSIFNKVKEVLDNTVNNIKEVAKENIKKEQRGVSKKEQIEKIKKITNETVDEINKLTKYVVERSYALIEKINGDEKNNPNNKIIHNEIKIEEEFKCEKCHKKVSYQIDKSKFKNDLVHKGIRCNGCGSFIWIKI